MVVAANLKCLADCNKPHTGDKATNMHLHPGYSCCVVRIGAASAKLLRWRGPIILEPKRWPAHPTALMSSR